MTEERQGVCESPADAGSCDAHLLRFFWDSGRGRCRPFMYNGCQGNRNNFKTERACFGACNVGDRQVKMYTRESCGLPADRGNCTAILKRWSYDPSQQGCQVFEYGGCGGNNNNFYEEGDCLALCSYFTCPPLEGCEVQCQYGFTRDASGCDVCSCYDPCQEVTCPVGHVCTAQPTKCWREPCPPPSGVCTRVTTTTEEPGCEASRFGCCLDGETRAQGLGLAGCPGKKEVAPTLEDVESLNVTVLQGNDVGLPCTALGAPAPRISWFKGEFPVEMVDRLRLNLEPNGTLSVINAELRDAGSYTCKAYNGVGPAVTRTFAFAVHAKVAFETAITAVTSHLGGSVSLTCKARGMPHPIVEWLRHDQVMRSSDRIMADGGSLTISDVSMADHGEYYCRGTNEEGSAALAFIITVQEPVRAAIKRHDKYLDHGATLVLTCQASGIPAPSLTWHHADIAGDDKQVLTPGGRVDVSGGELEVVNVTEKDAGRYICTAANGFTQAVSSTRLFVKPKVTKLPDGCTDRPNYANCQLVVRAGFCRHRIYGKEICCATCYKAEARRRFYHRRVLRTASLNRR